MGKGPLLERRAFWWNHHVHRYWRAHDQGIDSPCTIHHEDQSRGASRAQVLGLDWRVNPIIPVNLSADVDLEGGVRRIGSDDRAPQVFLMRFWSHAYVHGIRKACRMDHSNVHAFDVAPLLAVSFRLRFVHKTS